MSGGTELFIFNIDTFRPGFTKAPFHAECDGYLEVFRGEGEHWSFVEPGPHHQVLRTTEKERTSNLCSDGLYHFRQKALFDEAMRGALDENETVRGEYYVAPLYNRLIAQGCKVMYQVVPKEQIIFCGTPDEYMVLLTNPG